MQVSNIRPIFDHQYGADGASRTEKEQLKDSLRHFRKNFLTGAAFGFCRDVLSSFVYSSPPAIHIQQLFRDTMMTGFQLSMSPLVNSVARAHFKPELKTVRQWVFWTAKTSVVTTVILRTINMAFVGRPTRRRAKQFARALPVQISTGLGFDIGSGLAQYYLPPPKAMGGTFAREAATLTIADFSSTCMALPFLRGSEMGVAIKGWIGSVPLILYDTALYSLVRHGTRKYLK